MALILCYRFRGDPRGRGTLGHPLLMFLSWRLGLHTRLAGTILDAEYFDELFDSALLSGAESHITMYQHILDKLPIDQFFDNSKQDIEVKYSKTNILEAADEQASEKFKYDQCLDRPFSHWTTHRHYIKGPGLAKCAALVTNSIGAKVVIWLLDTLPSFCPRGIPWKTLEARSLIRNLESRFEQYTRVGLVGESLVDYGSSLLARNTTEPEDTRPLATLLRSDISSFNPSNTPGYMFSWGSNGLGQLGSVNTAEDITALLSSKPFIINTPRAVLPLKDIFIQHVECGHAHTLASLKSGVLLAWGCNKAGQLGLGPNAPDIVPTPNIVTGLPQHIVSFSSGSEHSLAVCEDDTVYAWGQGEGGTLGLGNQDMKSRNIPTLIPSLSESYIKKVKCGGLHSLALTRDGRLFSWGRGEGGQLGHPAVLLTTTNEGDVYLSTPTMIEVLAHNFIEEVVAGDAHSVCLDRQGNIFIWGFSSSGQLGLGLNAENHNINTPGLQVFEPRHLNLPRDMKCLQVSTDN